jgi:hypothetical protein
MNHLVLLALAFVCVVSIKIPCLPKRPRCMIVYSVGEAETVKVDIKLPVLPQQQSDEHYVISWRNTETE